MIAVNSTVVFSLGYGSCCMGHDPSRIFYFMKEKMSKATFEKIECQQKMKNSIQGCSLKRPGSFTTDLASDYINHNSYLDFTVF